MTEEEQQASELDRLVESIMVVIDAEDSKIYSRQVIDEFKDPANVGMVGNPDGIGIADGLCNDTMEITLKLEGNRISKCMFFTDGCGATIACGSRLTRMAIGRTVDEALAIRPEDLEKALGGLPEEHKHCASLAVIALRNAVRNCMKHREGQGGL